MTSNHSCNCFRFHKVVWGPHGMSDSSHSAGVVVAGADNGSVYYYDAAGLIEGDEDCLMFKNNKHVGAVKALDFNPFQVRIRLQLISCIKCIMIYHYIMFLWSNRTNILKNDHHMHVV